MTKSTMDVSPVGILSTSKRSLPLFLGLLCAQAVAAVTLILSARSLGPREYGLAMVAVGVGTFAATLLDFGGSAFATRQLAQDPARAEAFQRTLGARLSLTGLSVVLGAVWWVVSPPALSLYGFVLPIASLVSIEQFSLAPLRAKLLNGRVAFVFVLDKLVSLGFVIVCIKVGALGPPTVIAALCLGPVLGASGAVVISRRSDCLASSLRIRPRLALPWRGTRHLGIGGVATGAQSLDAQVIQAFGGNLAVGEYAAVARWSAPLGMVSTALSQSLFPVMAVSPSHRHAWRQARSALWFLMIPGAGLILLATFASPVVHLTLGDAYAGSVGVIRVLALGLMPALVNQPMSAFLQARGQERSTAKILVVGISAQLALMALLSGTYGAVGASVAFAVAQSAMLGMFGWSVHHVLKYKEGPKH